MGAVDGVRPAEMRSGWRSQISNWAVAICSVGLVAIALAGKHFHVEEAWMFGVAAGWTILSLGTGLLLSRFAGPTEDKEFGAVLKGAKKQSASYWGGIGAATEDAFERDFLEVDDDDTLAPGPGERVEPLVEGTEPFGAVASRAATESNAYWAEVVSSDFDTFLGLDDD